MSDHKRTKYNKYERAKNACKEWAELYSKLQTENTTLKNNIVSLQEEIQRWKSLVNELPDDTELDEIRRENEELKTNLHNTKKTFKEQREQFRKQISELEKEKLILTTRVQQLQDSKSELQERLRDMKEDMRELIQRKK